MDILPIHWNYILQRVNGDLDRKSTVASDRLVVLSIILAPTVAKQVSQRTSQAGQKVSSLCLLFVTQQLAIKGR